MDSAEQTILSMLRRGPAGRVMRETRTGLCVVVQLGTSPGGYDAWVASGYCWDDVLQQILDQQAENARKSIVGCKYGTGSVRRIY